MKSVLMFNIACEIQLKNIRKLDTEEHHVGTEAVRSKKYVCQIHVTALEVNNRDCSRLTVCR